VGGDVGQVHENPDGTRTTERRTATYRAYTEAFGNPYAVCGSAWQRADPVQGA
jgi:hypothetical protein